MKARTDSERDRYWPLLTVSAQRREAADVPRILIQQDCIPHYRVPVFKLLTESPHVRVTIISDHKLEIPFLKVVDGEQYGLRHIKAKTHFLSRRLSVTWQPAAVPYLFNERPDVLIMQGAFNSITAWALCLSARMLGIPVLLWGHGLLKEEYGPRWWLRRALYKTARGQLLQGDYAKQLLTKKGFDPNTLHVIYNSLDYDTQQKVISEITDERMAEVKASFGVAAGERMVAFIGRLQATKRLDLLLTAVALLSDRGMRVHLALVGEGEENASLRSLANKLAITSRVHFIGETYDEKRLGTIIGAADLVVVPSGAGLSVMHALTFGTPVLLHDRIEYHGPEWESVKVGVTGFYYKYGDVNDMAYKIEAALFPDPKKLQMSGYCKGIISERYNPHRQVETILAAVRSVTEKP